MDYDYLGYIQQYCDNVSHGSRKFIRFSLAVLCEVIQKFSNHNLMTISGFLRLVFENLGLAWLNSAWLGGQKLGLAVQKFSSAKMVSLVIRLYNFMIYIAIMYTVKAISKISISTTMPELGSEPRTY